MYSEKAIDMIMNGYKKIIAAGGNTAENRKDLLKDFCLAANYAGIAFGRRASSRRFITARAVQKKFWQHIQEA